LPTPDLPLELGRHALLRRLAAIVSGNALVNASALECAAVSATDARHSDKIPGARTGIGERVADSSGAQGMRFSNRLWTIPLIGATWCNLALLQKCVRVEVK